MDNTKFTYERNFLTAQKGDVEYNLFFRLYKQKRLENDKWILILHGILSSSAAMTGISEYLATKGYNVLAPDLLGHGYSKASRIEALDYTVSNIVELVHLILEELGLQYKQIHLLGHSAGGIVAQEYIRTYPNEVRKLILSSTTCKILKGMGWGGGLSQEALDAFKSIAKEGIDKTNIKLNIFTEKCDSQKAREAQLSGGIIARQADRNAISLFILQNIRIDYRAYLEEINIPVLILIGDRDSLFSVQEAFFMYTHIKDPYLYIFKGKNHASFITDSVRYNHIVYDFLSNNLDKCDWYTNIPLPDKEDISISNSEVPNEQPYVSPFPPNVR